MRAKTVAAALLALCVLSGCNGGGSGGSATTGGGAGATGGGNGAFPMTPADRSAGAFRETDPWILRTTDPNAARGNHGIFLGNGYMGATFGAQGVGDDKSVCYVAGMYDKDETLAKFPVWNKIDGLPAPKAGEYEQTLDMRRGVLTTKLGGGVTVTAFIMRDPTGKGAKARLYDASLDAVIHFEGVPQPKEAPKPLPVDHHVFDCPVGEEVAVYFTDRPDASGSGWTRYVQVQKIQRTYASSHILPAYTSTYETSLKVHTDAWAKLWKSDVQIDGDPEAQQLVHKLMFDLLQSAQGEYGAESIPPETLSGDFYKGHIFWDAEIWMFPALLAQHPDYARSMLEYRFAHLPQARAQAKSKGFAGADFPWESAATGRETAPGGFSDGRHVTAGVGWAAWQYYLATQDKAWLQTRGWPLLSGVAEYWASRAKRNAATGKWDVRNVFGPDELKGRVDNNTYTNALARYCLLAAGEAARVVGKPVNPKWKTVADNIALPFDKANNRYLAREADDGKATKQADGELVVYPASLPMTDATARATFDYHASRPIKNGPAMTASVHALIAARQNRPTEAETYFRASYKPFVRGPFLLLSEKRSLDRCVFTTAAGGVLQSVLYGYGGVDFQTFPQIAKGPAPLPPTWKKLTLTGVRHGKKTYTVSVTPQGRAVAEEKGF